MARPLRIYYEGAWYHVMSRGIHRENIFYEDYHRYTFLHLLGKAKDIYGIEIHAYCLMSNHYHLIVHTPRANISHAMKYINAIYAQFINMNMKRDGPLFKGRFKSILIDADEYLVRLSRYIHLNPLKAKMVSHLANYKWSSYPNYIGKTKYPNWLNKNKIIEVFGKKIFCSNYINYVENNNDDELDNFYKSDKFNLFLGGDKFCELTERIKLYDNLSPEIVRAKHIRKPPSMQKITNHTANYFDVDANSIFKINRKYGNIPRQIVIYISRNLSGYSIQEIADFIKNINYKGVSKAIARVNRSKFQMQEVKKIINKINNSRN